MWPSAFVSPLNHARRALPLLSAMFAVLTVPAVVVLRTSVAWAADTAVAPTLPHASPRLGLLRVVLGLGSVLLLAFAAAHPKLRGLEKRFGLTVLLSTGLPFLVLGVLFRLPQVGILTDAIVADLRPALEFGLGWLGFLVGMNFDVRQLDGLPARLGGVVLAASVIPLVTVTMVTALTLVGFDHTWTLTDLRSVSGLGRVIAPGGLRDAIALGACAAPAAPVAAIAIARSSGSAAARLVSQVTKLNDIAGILVLAILSAYYRPSDAFSTWRIPPVAWVLLTLGLAVLLGVLSYVLVRSARSKAEEFALLLGAIALTAGVAGHFSISPLVTGAGAGAVFVNLPHAHAARLQATVRSLERPLYLIFLLVAGALWNASAWQGWVLAPMFVFARVSGKIIGAHVAKYTGPDLLPDASTLGLALAPQSPISIATIVGYVTLYGVTQRAADGWLMTACIAGAVLTEVTVQAIVHARGGLRFDVAPADYMRGTLDSIGLDDGSDAAAGEVAQAMVAPPEAERAP